MPIGFPAGEQGSAVGAALLGHVALGHLDSVDEAAAVVRTAEVVQPDRDVAAGYRRLLSAFESIGAVVEDLPARFDVAFPTVTADRDRKDR